MPIAPMKIRIFFFAIATASILTVYAFRKSFINNAILTIAPSISSHSIGEKLDSFQGVYVYYNGDIDHVLERNVAKDGYNIGLKYQCVEFVKRYYYLHYKHKMPNSYGHAKDFYNKKLTDNSINKDRNLYQFSNPSNTKPRVGDILVFDGHLGNPYGHVAIVSQVLDNQIEIIQQNPGPGAPSREFLDMEYNNHKYSLAAGLGWIGKRTP